ncbi:MAG: hypothetical protein N2513_06650 [Deltaproteobacteria bacterium]|nr:hypothetical protein [Deltaproteobacteria bacterium]
MVDVEKRLKFTEVDFTEDKEKAPKASPRIHTPIIKPMESSFPEKRTINSLRSTTWAAIPEKPSTKIGTKKRGMHNSIAFEPKNFKI